MWIEELIDGKNQNYVWISWKGTVIIFHWIGLHNKVLGVTPSTLVSKAKRNIVDYIKLGRFYTQKKINQSSDWRNYLCKAENVQNHIIDRG